jgi:hypothetical protein
MIPELDKLEVKEYYSFGSHFMIINAHGLGAEGQKIMYGFREPSKMGKYTILSW